MKTALFVKFAGVGGLFALAALYGFVAVRAWAIGGPVWKITESLTATLLVVTVGTTILLWQTDVGRRVRSSVKKLAQWILEENYSFRFACVAVLTVFAVGFYAGGLRGFDAGNKIAQANAVIVQAEHSAQEAKRLLAEGSAHDGAQASKKTLAEQRIGAAQYERDACVYAHGAPCSSKAWTDPDDCENAGFSSCESRCHYAGFSSCADRDASIVAQALRMFTRHNEAEKSCREAGYSDCEEKIKKETQAEKEKMERACRKAGFRTCVAKADAEQKAADMAAERARQAESRARAKTCRRHGYASCKEEEDAHYAYQRRLDEAVSHICDGFPAGHCNVVAF